MDIQTGIATVLETIRNGVLAIANLIGKYIPFEAGQIYLVLSILICLFLGYKLVGSFKATEDNFVAKLMVTGLLYYFVFYK
jgi:hypothetical protein